MKRTIIILLVAMLLTGCAPKDETPQSEIGLTEDGGQQTATTDPVVDEQGSEDDVIEPILISGIIVEISDSMVTVEIDDGIAEPIVIIKLSEETAWDVPKDIMNEGQYITAEISPMMTRSIPPQSNAVRIVSLNDVILGEVTEITDTQITLKPVNFYNHETVVVNISEETVWNVERESISAGHNIRVMVGMQMTASLPPQVSGLKVLSVETHD